MRYDASAQTMEDVPNRGNDNRIENDDASQVSITLYTIDEIILNYVNDVIQPSIDDNGALRRVDVIMGNAERWNMFRKDGVLRAPETDKALTPLIMVKRQSIERGELTNPVNKYVNLSWESGWNRRNAYDKFYISNNIRPSRKFHTVIIPDYVDIAYDFVVWTEYEEQMSNLLSQLQVESEEYWGVRNNYKFRVKMNTMDSETTLNSGQDRIVRTVFSLMVNAYLIPEKMILNAKHVSTHKKSYTVKKVVTMIETDFSQK